MGAHTSKAVPAFWGVLGTNTPSGIGTEAWRPSLLDFFHSGSYIVSVRAQQLQSPLGENGR